MKVLMTERKRSQTETTQNQDNSKYHCDSLSKPIFFFIELDVYSKKDLTREGNNFLILVALIQ